MKNDQKTTEETSLVQKLQAEHFPQAREGDTERPLRVPGELEIQHGQLGREQNTERPLTAAEELEKARREVGPIGWKLFCPAGECEDDDPERSEITRELLEGASIELLATLRAIRRLAQREVLRTAKMDGRRQTRLVHWLDREREALGVNWLNYQFEAEQGGRVVPEIPEEYKQWALGKLQEQADEQWSALPPPLTEADILRGVLSVLEVTEELFTAVPNSVDVWRQMGAACDSALAYADRLTDALRAVSP
jgi:hypothetical protein